MFFLLWRLMVNGDSGKNSNINCFLVVFILSQIDHGLLGLIYITRNMLIICSTYELLVALSFGYNLIFFNLCMRHYRHSSGKAFEVIKTFNQSLSIGWQRWADDTNEQIQMTQEQISWVGQSTTFPQAKLLDRGTSLHCNGMSI